MSDYDSETDVQDIEYSKPMQKIGSRSNSSSAIGGLSGLRGLNLEKKKEFPSFQLKGITTRKQETAVRSQPVFKKVEESSQDQDHLKIVLDKIESISSNFLDVIREQNNKLANIHELYAQRLTKNVKSSNIQEILDNYNHKIIYDPSFEQDLVINEDGTVSYNNIEALLAHIK